MNTKKIWSISIVLGIAVAGFIYITTLAKENASTPASASVSQTKQVANDKKSDEQKEKEDAKKKALEREFTNPIVDVAKGKRAISIKVDLEQGISGYVTPNSMVDVIAYSSNKDDKTKKEYKSAVLVLENVKVLTTGQPSDNKQDALKYQTVTMEVTTEEGVMLSLASKDKDGFYLMLRNNEDTQTGKQGYKQTREVIKDDTKEEN